MNEHLRVFRALSDETRLRILLLVSGRELCVCQIMAVLGTSQPLVSRNLNLLKAAGFLLSRREKKLMFYKLRPDLEAHGLGFAGDILKDLARTERAAEDRSCLQECQEFQKTTGRCDMKSFREFIRKKKKLSSGNGAGAESPGARR
ncbi:MAG: metalloregulator ArsR/SmtB family transcription factor [Nitrospiraceae bacterium]|nr:metalloregulator ArsR/SmtB family transcription factor [Nitrospiraceae bacterium]